LGESDGEVAAIKFFFVLLGVVRNGVSRLPPPLLYLPAPRWRSYRSLAEQGFANASATPVSYVRDGEVFEGSALLSAIVPILMRTERAIVRDPGSRRMFIFVSLMDLFFCCTGCCRASLRFLPLCTPSPPTLSIEGAFFSA